LYWSFDKRRQLHMHLRVESFRILAQNTLGTYQNMDLEEYLWFLHSFL
jgi:hypothetical protein